MNVKARKLIGIDLKTFSLNAAGIGRYTMELVCQLVERNKFQYVGFPSPNSDFHKIQELNVQNATGVYRKFNSSLIRSALLIPAALENNKIALLHSMDNSCILQTKKTIKCKRVSTIHDLVVFKYPQFFTKKHYYVVKNLLVHAVKNSDHIITVSDSTKRDLLNQFPQLNEAKISVTHLAASKRFKKIESDGLNNTIHIPSNFFFSLGTQEPRKNVANLVSAFLELKKNKNYENIKLLIAGGEGWLNSNQLLADKEMLQKKGIVVLGFVKERMLPILYSNALAFVYPSFYEGFGLPVLEAMSCGCPVITSNISSMPEIAGDSALYVDPYSIDSIKTCLQKIATNSALRNDLSNRAIIQSRKFSWTNTAEKTENAYAKLLS